MNPTPNFDPLKVLANLFEKVLKTGKLPQSVLVFLLAMFSAGILIFTTAMTEVALFLLLWQVVRAGG
jgi:hypothetical protein